MHRVKVLTKDMHYSFKLEAGTLENFSLAFNALSSNYICEFIRNQNLRAERVFKIFYRSLLLKECIVYKNDMAKHVIYCKILFSKMHIFLNPILSIHFPMHGGG